MLAAEHRLRHKKDFELIFNKGSKVYGVGLGLRFGKRYKADAPSRFGFMVGTKVSKLSVVRNRLKRRMREAVRTFVPRIPVGFDIVFIAFPDAKNFDFAQVRSQIEIILTKARLI